MDAYVHLAFLKKSDRKGGALVALVKYLMCIAGSSDKMDVIIHYCSETARRCAELQHALCYDPHVSSEERGGLESTLLHMTVGHDLP